MFTVRDGLLMIVLLRDDDLLRTIKASSLRAHGIVMSVGNIVLFAFRSEWFLCRLMIKCFTAFLIND